MHTDGIGYGSFIRAVFVHTLCNFELFRYFIVHARWKINTSEMNRSCFCALWCFESEIQLQLYATFAPCMEKVLCWRGKMYVQTWEEDAAQVFQCNESTMRRSPLLRYKGELLFQKSARTFSSLQYLKYKSNTYIRKKFVERQLSPSSFNDRLRATYEPNVSSRCYLLENKYHTYTSAVRNLRTLNCQCFKIFRNKKSYSNERARFKVTLFCNIFSVPEFVFHETNIFKHFWTTHSKGETLLPRECCKFKRFSERWQIFFVAKIYCEFEETKSSLCNNPLIFAAITSFRQVIK